MQPKALKNAELRKLLAAQLPADFADWLDFVAIGALLAFVWEAPNHAYALLAVGMGLPYLLIGPFAGVLVDRWPTKAALVWSNLGRAVVTAAFFFAESWPVLIAFVALRSSVDCFFTPAKQAAIQALTVKDERASANGLSHGINQASKIVAPGIGGAFLVWFAPSIIFLVNAFISAIAALLAMRLARIDRVASGGGNSSDSVLAGVKNGLGVVSESVAIRSVLMIMAASYFAMFIYDTFIAPLTRHLNFEAQHLGYALAAVGIGGVCGSVLFSFLPELKRPQFWIAAGAAIGSLMLLMLGTLDLSNTDMSLAILIGIFAVLGFTSSMAIVPVRVVLQNTVPEDKLGAISALSEAANTVALLSAPFFGAMLSDAFSVRAPFIAGGIVTLAVALGATRVRIE